MFLPRPWLATLRRSTTPRKPDSRANTGVVSGRPMGSMESTSISPSSIRYRPPTLTCGRVQMRTLQVMSPRRTPSRKRLVNVIGYRSAPFSQHCRAHAALQARVRRAPFQVPGCRRLVQEPIPQSAISSSRVLATAHRFLMEAGSASNRSLLPVQSCKRTSATLSAGWERSLASGLL
jgi:hypothetical protein